MIVYGFSDYSFTCLLIFCTMLSHVETGNTRAKAGIYSEGFVAPLIPFRPKINPVVLNEL